jgi:hypothetical protein
MSFVSSMKALMRFQISKLAEAFATILALKWFFSGVHAHMGFEIADLAKGLLASPTNVGFWKGHQRGIAL